MRKLIHQRARQAIHKHRVLAHLRAQCRVKRVHVPLRHLHRQAITLSETELELFRRPNAQQPTVGHDSDARAQPLRLFHRMRGEHDGLALAARRNRLPQRVLRLWIESCRGLVEEHDRRRRHQADRDRQAPPHSARVRFHLSARGVLQLNRFERARHHLRVARARHRLEPREKVQVLAAREVKVQNIKLRAHAHRLMDAVHV
mmetsp:Transcript_3571/g.7795  ORF Transcript_3571/g.7795 Transcript_3571/m.7795 type:complete len:202 (-) Transcript_3571:2046-2651(-)